MVCTFSLMAGTKAEKTLPLGGLRCVRVGTTPLLQICWLPLRLSHTVPYNLNIRNEKKNLKLLLKYPKHFISFSFMEIKVGGSTLSVASVWSYIQNNVKVSLNDCCRCKQMPWTDRIFNFAAMIPSSCQCSCSTLLCRGTNHKITISEALIQSEMIDDVSNYALRPN